MKIRNVLFITVVLAVLLAACGGGGDSGGDPVGTVKNVVSAMENLDVEEANKYICEARQEELDMESGFAELEAAGIDPQELLDAFKIDVKDDEYEEKSASEDSATVHVSGNISLDFDTEKLKSVLKKAAEASGEEVSDEELDFVVGMFTSMGGQEAPFEGDVELIKEDGKWVVCDELDFLDSEELFSLP